MKIVALLVCLAAAGNPYSAFSQTSASAATSLTGKTAPVATTAPSAATSPSGSTAPVVTPFTATATAATSPSGSTAPMVTASTVPAASTAPVVTSATLRTPVYPFAVRGWDVPLGQRDRDPGSVINRLIIHHTTNTGDETPYFLRHNERLSCPTWYVMANGDVVEFISPEKRPSSTGAANTYSVAIETQNTSRAPDWGISDASHEAIAQIAAWLSRQTHFGAYPVAIKLDRTHIIGHNEAGVNPSACPGPSMRLDWIVERAKQLAEEPPTPATPAPEQ